QAAYLFEGHASPEAEWYNVGTRTLECTKRMISLKFVAALELVGTDYFDDYITSRIDLARAFAERLGRESDFELAPPPECNIVCFRYRAPGGEDARERDALQVGIRRRLAQSGRFYLVQTRLDRGVFLRLTIINPLTRLDDLDALLESVREAAKDLGKT